MRIVRLLALNYKISRIKHVFHSKGKPQSLLIILEVSVLVPQTKRNSQSGTFLAHVPIVFCCLKTALTQSVTRLQDSLPVFVSTDDSFRS